ncbi:MAG: hydroxymethylglutaryl-CoA lyase [Propionibacteriaceae bacterium]
MCLDDAGRSGGRVRDVDAFPDPHPVGTDRPGSGSPVRVYEVGPRDGLQAEDVIVPTATKVDFIRRLVDSGLTTVEATSFVAPKWVPQLADAAEVMAQIKDIQAVRFPVLVPNAKGLHRALAASGVHEVAVFVSATESFARSNLGTTMTGALELAAPVIAAGLAAGLRVRGYVSMCFGDPWEGRVPIDQPVRVARSLLDAGAQTISMGDTIGVGTAGHVLDLVAGMTDAGIGPEKIALHFHDTYGQALANVIAGLSAGVCEFDASAGGLGGCPYAKSATGNLATEDLVWLLHGLGIDTGIDLAALVRTSVWMAAQLGRPAPSRVVQAMAKAG